MALTVGIVADDLTGAADAAAPFARRGVAVRVAFGGLAESGSADEAEVLAVSTESRDLAAGCWREAFARTREATEAMLARKPRLLFKKVDSTLRGHVGVELAAVLRANPGRRVLLCPAFPANGRSVGSGLLTIHGAGLETTEFLRPGFRADRPIGIAEYLGVVRRAAVVRGHEDVGRLREEVAASGDARVLLCDASDEGHLRTIARLAVEEPAVWLLAGSAGLAGALAAELGPDGLRATAVAELGVDGFRVAEVAKLRVDGVGAEAVGGPRRARGVLIVAGSRSGATRRQLERLPEGACVVVDGRERDFAADAAARMERIGVSSVVSPAVEIGDRAQVASLLGEVARRTIELCARSGTDVGALVLTGGDTAIHVARSLGAASMSVRGEVAPGVPIGELEGGAWRGLTVITKAGGFGEADMLVRCIAAAGGRVE